MDTNDIKTKEQALELLNLLQSKFNISKNDINENFNKSLNDDNTISTKIQLLTFDEAILKLLIPYNNDNWYNNRVQDYPIANNTDGNGKLYFEVYQYGSNGPNMKIPQKFLFRTGRESSYCGFIASETNLGWRYKTVQYQDNRGISLEVRIRDIKRGFRKNGYIEAWEGDYDIYKNGSGKNGDSSYKGFLPVIKVTI